jgi:hypothetical protein
MIKAHINIAVEIPLADPTNKLIIEPGTNGYIVLSNGQFKVGVNEKLLLEAIRELDWMKIKHSLPKEEEVKPEPAMGEIIEGDDIDVSDVPF